MTKRIELLDIIEKLQSMTEQGAIEWQKRYKDSFVYMAQIGNCDYVVYGDVIEIYKTDTIERLHESCLIARIMPPQLLDVMTPFLHFRTLIEVCVSSKSKFTSYDPIWKQLDKHEKDFLATKAPERVEN